MKYNARTFNRLTKKVMEGQFLSMDERFLVVEAVKILRKIRPPAEKNSTIEISDVTHTQNETI